jgi:hypothetical protein
MSIFVGKHTLNANTATMIVPIQGMPQHCYIHNPDHGGQDDVYIGGSALGTALNGIHIPDTETVEFVLQPGDALFAIASAGTPEVQVIVSRM